VLQQVADLIYVKQFYVARVLCKALTLAPRYARVYCWDTSVILSQKNVLLAGRHCTDQCARRGLCCCYTVKAHSWWRLCLLECAFKRRSQLLKLYSVGGRWNERIRNNVGKIMAGETRNSQEITVSHCHFVCHKSHMSWPAFKLGPPRWEAGEWPPEPSPPDTCVSLWYWH
jgi:hypothetical protein